MAGKEDTRGVGFGARLRAYRREAGLTQQELASMAGISVATIRDLEQARSRHPHPRSIRGLQSALGLFGPDAMVLRRAGEAGTGSDLAAGRPEAVHSDGAAQPMLGILGPLMVHAGGLPASLTSVRQRLLLGRLALSVGAAVNDAELIDVLWGEIAPASARTLLQTYVSRLRRRFEVGRGHPGSPRIVHLTAGGYRLDVEVVDLDVLRYRTLVDNARGIAASKPALALKVITQALSLWRGDLLEDLPKLAGHPLAVALADERIAGTLLHADLADKQGRHILSLPGLRALAHRHPLHEELHARLMLALAACGRQAAALAVFDVLRNRLADELGIDPGAAMIEYRQRVLRQQWTFAADPLGEGVGDRYPPATARRSVPAHLPPGVEGFAGRDDELALLDSAVSRLVVISGLPGVGKTTLAVHWAHGVAARFPDGQLYINLRGFDPGRRSTEPTEAVGRFLEALGVPASGVPRGMDAQTALYRSLISGRRMLVVLDNAHDADQVRPLLPGTASVVVLVTSRNRLTGLVAIDGARPVSLGVMSPAESRELLLRRLGADRVDREEEHAARIVTLCAGLPLALAIVAARAQESSFSLASLAGELGRSGRQLDSFDAGDSLTRIRAVFSWSYQALTTAGAHLFRLLGLHPGPDFGIRAAESLAGADARAGLAELTRASLLIEYDAGRYALHDLLRAYAIELISEADRPDEAFARLADHYLHSAAAADRLLNPLRSASILELGKPATGTRIDDAADPAVWFAAERANLLAILGRAAETGLERPTWQLAWAADTALERLGHWQELVGSWELALSVTRDSQARAYAHRRLAHGFTLLGREAEAEAQLLAVLRLYEEAADLAGQAITHHSLSYMYDTVDNVEQALHHSELAVACSERTGDSDELARALNAVGWCHVRLGDHARALTYCRQALTLIDPSNHRTLADTWDSIGYAHHHLGEYALAADAYRKALTMARQSGDRYLEATLLTHLGDTCVATGNREAARAAWRPAIDLLATIDESAAATLSHRLADLDR